MVYAISKLLERWGFDSEYAEQLRNQLGSAQFSIEQILGQTTTARTGDLVMIPVPTQQTPQSKLLQLKLTARTASIERLVVYKQCIRSIQF